MMKGIDRFWLFTWTTYGSWLPGDDRGSVTRVIQPEQSHRGENDHFETPPTAAIPALADLARSRLRCHPIRLTKPQAELLITQFQETCDFRRWFFGAAAIMANHIHVLLGVTGDPDPDHILRDLKSYGSRALNRNGNRPASGTWWTQSGSKRKNPDETAVRNSIAYIRDQEFPLLMWVNPEVSKW